MKRIAFFVSTFPKLSEAFALREILGLSEQGVSITVCALEADPTVVRFAHEATTCLYRPSWISWPAVASIGWLFMTQPGSAARLLVCLIQMSFHNPIWSLRMLRNLHAMAYFAHHLEQASVEQVHGYFLNQPSVVALGVSIVLRVPLTLAGHARDVFVEPGPLEVLLRHAHLVRVCNADAANELARRAPTHSVDRIRLIHHGINLKEWCCDHGREGDQGPQKYIFVAAGRFVAKKGFDVLLRSWRLLHDNKAQLVIAGDGPMRPSLQRMIDTGGLASRVILPGWLSPEQVRSLLCQAYAVVIPSVVADDGDRDGIPNVLLEAAACGVPAIVTCLPGLSEIVRHEENGLLCAPGDPAELARAIERISSDVSLQHRLSVGARVQIQRSFDAQQSLRKLWQFFAEAEAIDAAA